MTSDNDILRIYLDLEQRFKAVSIALQQLSISHFEAEGIYLLDSYFPPKVGETEYAFYNWNCAILTAFRGSDSLSPEENFTRNVSRNNSLKTDMTECGLLFRPVDGCYKEAGWEFPSVELCFFVTNTNFTGDKVYSQEEKLAFFTQIYRLAEKYEQDSFLYTFPGNNRVAFLIATNDGGRAEFRNDIKFAGPLFTHVQAINAWTDCSDGRISFQLKGMIMKGGTGNRKVNIGEGELFDIDGYNPDGLVAIREKHQNDLKSACKDYNGSTPLIERFFVKENLTEEDIHKKVLEALKSALELKCKRIGFHCSAAINGDYQQGAKIVLDTVLSWAKKHNNKLEWIVLVDIYGDYCKANK